MFHGRDWPADRRLLTLRSKLLRITETAGDEAQVNRPLRREFTEVLRRVDWQLALLQEAPPRWFRALRRDLDADGARVLTSRNFVRPLQSLLANLNPDLIASSEGGSNQLLVRSPWRIEAVRRHTLARRPERRRMLWARLRGPDARELCVANMHGSVHSVSAAPEQVLRAAERAVEWSRELPLIFGGDLNLRPATEPTVFPELERRFELAPPTGPRAIDHLLVRGLDLIEPPHALPDDVRRVAVRDGLRARLSDHACVVAVLGMR